MGFNSGFKGLTTLLLRKTLTVFLPGLATFADADYNVHR